jgi:hypothetical protein
MRVFGGRDLHSAAAGALSMTREEERLAETAERTAYWNRWGPYLAERAWGTVREDYSANGDAWHYLTHDAARSRAYRWNEDGIGGICDRHQFVCFSIAMWNGVDPILKERLYGLTGTEGNHGEDVKEQYFYLDSTPTHSYLKFLYKYPQQAFPYNELLEKSKTRTREDPEFELLDTGIFDESRYFDVLVEYAKASPEDIAIRITVSNRGPDTAAFDLLPTIWFRNTWSWKEESPRPSMANDGDAVRLDGIRFGARWLHALDPVEWLFTENETNQHRLFDVSNRTPFVKDAFHRYVVNGESEAVNPSRTGTKAAARYPMELAPGESAVVKLRLSDEHLRTPFGEVFDSVFIERISEADDFYSTVIPEDLPPDGRNVMRQALSGMLWSKQFYHYVVRDWLLGDPAYPPPPPERLTGRNHDWTHVYAADVISMPDKWEYPWFAAWDLAFHTVALSIIDPGFAKSQLSLMVREWYMHPNGQLPAYEWNFGDANPPVHSWAAYRIFKIEQKRRGHGDRRFLEHLFFKLLLNFTWWVNRKDIEGRNVFQGGFLGLDNIGLFDRSKPLPTGGEIEQADGTGWMAMYSLNLLAMAMELARQDSAYEYLASKFWEHFLFIAHAITRIGNNGFSLWNEEDGFFYDVLRLPDGGCIPLKLRSMVGLIPLFAVQTLEGSQVDSLPGFKRRMDWFIENRPDLTGNVAAMDVPGQGERRLMSIVDADQLRRILGYVLDEKEFLSPFGIRSLSKAHENHPYVFRFNGHEDQVDYEPAESRTGLFGGNSNWRGPVWMPLNFLLIESLQRFHHYYGDRLKVECPTGSGKMMNLWDVAEELSRRLVRLFMRDESGRRPVNAAASIFDTDPHWRDLVLFYEYFHGDNGAGLGANHQTGWTGLVAKLLQQSGCHDLSDTRDIPR